MPTETEREPTYDITSWSSLYDTVNSRPAVIAWPELVRLLGKHLAVARKDAAPGFGPYRLKSGGRRRDADVEAVTLAVFDVDVGTWDEMAGCYIALDQAGISQAWYTTYSHRPEKPSYRLVVPLERPVHPSRWPEARRYLIEQFRVPADLKRCSGCSHFYYLPSRPADVVGEVESYATVGKPYPTPAAWTEKLPGIETSTRAAGARLFPGTGSLPPAAVGPVDLGPLREKLEAKYRRLVRRQGRFDKERAQILRRLLDGEQLARHGARNDTCLRACGMLAWSLPGTPVAILMHLMRPSIEAMIADGSSIKWSEVERMIETAILNKAAADAADESFREALERVDERAKSAIKDGTYR